MVSSISWLIWEGKGGTYSSFVVLTLRSSKLIQSLDLVADTALELDRLASHTGPASGNCC